MIKRLGFAVATIVFLVAAAFTVAIALFPPQRPQPIAATSNAHLAQTVGGAQAARAAFADLPPPQHLRARDGALLAYRFYPGTPGRGVAVLVHGSSGSSSIAHLAAKALARSGITVIAPDIRGHGDSGPRGDIRYLGQLDDDMQDLASMLAARFPHERKLLIGHSSGGGFALRIAGGPHGDAFDGYIALSPYLDAASPTTRPRSGGWAGIAIPRIVAISVLDRFGIHAFDGLPTLAFAIPPGGEEEGLTPAYSYRLMTNFGLPHFGWEETLRDIRRPTIVLVGDADQLFRADQFAPVLARLNPRIAVRVTPNVDHMGMMLAPAAIDALVESAHGLLDAPTRTER